MMPKIPCLLGPYMNPVTTKFHIVPLPSSRPLLNTEEFSSYEVLRWLQYLKIKKIFAHIIQVKFLVKNKTLNT